MAIQMWYIIRWILGSYIDAFKIPSSASLERSASKLILSSAVLLISVYIHVYRWYLISSLHWVYGLWVQTINIVKKAPYSSTTLRENAFTIVSLLRATNKTILHDITSTYTIGLVLLGSFILEMLTFTDPWKLSHSKDSRFSKAPDLHHGCHHAYTYYWPHAVEDDTVCNSCQHYYCKNNDLNTGSTKKKHTPYFLKIWPHLEILLPSKCRRMFLQTHPNERALEISPHGKGSPAIYVCARALYAHTNMLAVYAYAFQSM